MSSLSTFFFFCIEVYSVKKKKQRKKKEKKAKERMKKRERKKGQKKEESVNEVLQLQVLRWLHGEKVTVEMTLNITKARVEDESF